MSEAAGDWVGREVTDSPLATLQEFKLLQRAEAAEARVKEQDATIAELRALCREAAEQMDPGDEHGPNEEPCEWCNVLKRLRAAGEEKQHADVQRVREVETSQARP